MTPDALIFFGIPLIFLLVLYFAWPRKPAPKKQAQIDAFRQLVMDELRKMELTEAQSEVINAWAWATKNGWSYVAEQRDSFPFLFRQLETSYAPHL